MFRIPVYQPDLSGNEKKYVTECLDTTWISSKGRFISEFERGFASFVGAQDAASACNGTVALHLALLAAGIGPGDEVIVPSFTYIASVNAIRYVGAIPVFADSLRDTWQLDPEEVERLATPRTRAVMAVHLYGGACDVRALREICDRRGLVLVEDCAEALGTTLDGQHVGTFGDVATFSFFGNKTLTTGEGGMLVCRDAGMLAKVRHFRGQGLADNREYWHDVIGYNYRMTNICAAIGLAQLERIEHILAAKIALANRYRAALVDSAVTFQASTPGERSSHWMVTILTPTPQDRDPLRQALADAGIETRPAFHLAHRMPMYEGAAAETPVGSDISERGINLPSWHGLPQEALQQIAGIIGGFPWQH